MRVSLKWLREFVDIEVSPEELAEQLTLAGLAVEAIHCPGKEIQQVFTGRIVKIEPHPNADKLVVCRVSLGAGEPLQIVTGAPNVAEGQVVALAVEGARLNGGLIIKKAKFRGVESSGMLCSWQELGFDAKYIPADQVHGIMVLPPDTPAGMDVKPLLGLDDVILELEVTPNRGDCLSMAGIAREVAAIFNRPFRFPRPQVAELAKNIAGLTQVDILNPELCGRYVARLFTNVRLRPSPLWMQERLRAAGVRPISNIVDITNYVMMELGQPLHAFDFDTLREGRIIVRTAKEGEALVSLDGVTRQLTREMLVIADTAAPVAIAGVMGGLETEVTEKTVNVLLESAHFNPLSIRRTSKALGLRSEASARFEKGVDREGCLLAAARAAQLLGQIQAGDVLTGVVDNYPSRREPVKILLRPARVNYVLGTELATEEISATLTRLHFEVNNAGEELLINVPSYRNDVHQEIDLIEEVARLHGYNKIPGTLPCGVNTLGIRAREGMIADRVKEILVGCGLTEVVTFSFVNPGVFDQFNLPAQSKLREVVKLQNPLSEEHSVMRTWLLPGLVEVLRRNFNRRVMTGAVFEIGRVFYPRANELPEEPLKLAAAGMGEIAGGWNVPGLPVDYYFLKGVLETLQAQIGVNFSFTPEREHPAFHPGRTARVASGEEDLGILGEIHPDVLEKLELPLRVVAFELDFGKIIALAQERKEYEPLPRFPAVQRDLALLVPRNVPAQVVGEIIKQAGGPLLRSVTLFDVYEGEQVKKGFRSLAFSLKFLAGDRTLTVEEVASCIENIAAELVQKAGAEIRGEKIG
ncbi:MAG: phenylalanine--tRNA ligase subunit beta [Bacillota bacterium]